MILFHLKSFFRSQDIQSFVIVYLLSSFSKFKGSDETGIIVTGLLWIGLHKLKSEFLE